ncbi:dockerin type I domain-containing protein [Halobaculum sp. EA56]|uniref:dockerin type I domain-containing protein n=1 Tax=Halobaculum sp. EA56 TaxID=3421648 RepID=UPI003EB803BC
MTVEETADVTGRVVDATGDGLSNDGVALQREAGGDRNVTDSHGNFTLTVANDATYQWVYFQGEDRDTAPADGVPDFYPIGSVSVSGDTSLGTEQLPRGHNLTIRTVRPDGTAVANATVHVYQERNGADFGTDRITDGSGETTLEVNGDLHIAVEPPAGADLARNDTDVTVTADETVEVVLNPAVTVNGTVTDSTGAGAENVRVFYDTEGSHNTALTDSAGAYGTAVAANRTYRVDLTQEDLPDRPDFPDDGVPGVYAYGERAVGGSNVTHDYTLPYGHDVNVTVIGPDGSPVSGADVHVAHIAGDTGAGIGGETDANGMFVPSGADDVGIEANGTVRVHVEAPDGTRLGERFREIDVSSSRNVTVQLERVVSVSGRVETADGAAAADWEVGADPDEEGLTGFGERTASDGSFTGQVSQNGTYELFFRQRNYDDGAVQYPKDGVPDVHPLTAFRTDTANESLGTFTLPRGHLLNVTVVNESGAPVDGVDVYVETVGPEAEAYAHGVTTANGSLLLDGAAATGVEVNGTVRIDVEPSGGPYAESEVRLDVESNRSVTVTLERSANLSARIVGPNGTAVAEERVFAYPTTETRLGDSDWTDADGNVTLAVAESGTYEVGFQQVAGVDAFEPTFEQDGIPDLYALGVVNGTDGDFGTVQLPDPHTLTVIVENESGHRLADQRVDLGHVRNDASVFGRTRTGANGTVTAELAGEVTIYVPGTDRYTENFTRIELTEDRTVRIVLTEGVPVTGRVRYADGTNASDVTVDAFGEDGASGQTTANGTYSFLVGPNDGYDLAYKQTDFDDATPAFPKDGRADLYAFQRIQVGETGVDTGTQTVPPGHLVNVTVVNASGVPVTDVEVDVVPVNGDVTGHHPGYTNGDGEVVLQGARSPGIEANGTLRIHVPSVGPYIETVEEFDVDSRRNVTVVLERPATVTGRVVYPDNSTNADDAVVTFGSETGDAYLEVVGTDADGSFAIETPRASDVDLQFYQGEYWVNLNESKPVAPRDGVIDMYALTQVNTTDGDVNVGNRTLPEGHVVNVTVVDESGAPVPNATVSVSHYQGAITPAPEEGGADAGLSALPTNADGMLQFSAWNPDRPSPPPGIELSGNVSIEVTPPENATRFEDRTYTRNLTVTGEHNLTVTLEEQTTVSGRVVYPDNSTNANDAVVTFAGGLETDATDSDGRFELMTPNSDRVDVTFYQGEFWVPESNSSEIAPRDGVVDLYSIARVNTTDGDVHLGNVSLPDGHVVNVTVVDESGNPVQNATIDVSHISPDGANGGIGEIPSDAEGQLHFGDQEGENFTTPPGIELSGNVSVEVAPPANATRFENRTYTRNLTVTGERNLTVVLNETTLEPTLRAGSATVPPNGTTSVDLTLSSAPDGLAGYNVTVTVANSSVATVTNASAAAGFDLENVSVGPDGTTVTIKAADTDRVVEPGAENATIATVELRGDARGETAVSVQVNQMDADDGSVITPTVRAGTVTVGAPPAVVDDARPTDPDGDGRFEDLNGNGRVDFNDVVVMFQRFDDPDVSEYPAAYDFNGNGRVDFDDVVTLFEQL